MKRKPKNDGSLALREDRVIVIEATQQPQEKKLRVAAYARVSSDSTDQMNSFAAQTGYYTALITGKDNWTLVDLYADAGISGTSADKRPEFQRLLADCRRGLVDRILVKSISRFARNTKDCLEIVRELKSLGVGVQFEEQNIDTSEMSGELLTAVFAALAQKESESISGNMRWSYQRRMTSGKFITCKAPFGYRLNNGVLEIQEDEAEIVRLIFNLYLAGWNREEIAARVSASGIPTRDGRKQWNAEGITYIIQNEKYAGNALVQKWYTTESLPYQKKRNHGEREKYYLTDSHPPLVDLNVYQTAQELLCKRGERVSTRTHDDPLSKKIVCGSCGSVFKRKERGRGVYWICRNHYKSKENCPMLQIPEEEIHAAFLRVYHKLKFHGEAILTRMLADLRSIREQRMLWSVDVVELNKRISDLHDQNRLLTDLNKHGLVDSDIFISQSNELAAQLRAARRERERLLDDRDDDTVSRTKDLLELLDAMPSELHSFDWEIFGDLVEKIIVADNETLRFRLLNGLELTETIRRAVR